MLEEQAWEELVLGAQVLGGAGVGGAGVVGSSVGWRIKCWLEEQVLLLLQHLVTTFAMPLGDDAFSNNNELRRFLFIVMKVMTTQIIGRDKDRIVVISFYTVSLCLLASLHYCPTRLQICRDHTNIPIQ